MSRITYNHLNFPHTITGSGGTFSNVYDAAGKKWQSTIGGVTTTYFGDVEYERPIHDGRSDDVRQFVKGVNRESGWAGAIKAIYHQDGRILNNAGSYEYQYYVKDHLGNVRIVCNTAAVIQSEQHYYPFGERTRSSHTKWLVGEVETLRSNSLAMKACRCFQVTKPQSGMERMILKITISGVKTLCATAKVLLRENIWKATSLPLAIIRSTDTMARSYMEVWDGMIMGLDIMIL